MRASMTHFGREILVFVAYLGGKKGADIHRKTLLSETFSDASATEEQRPNTLTKYMLVVLVILELKRLWAL
jgi:hypothetical protein